MINEMERNKLSKSSGDLQRKKTDFPGTLPFKLDNFDLLYRKYAHGITIISAWDDNYKVMEISIEPTVCFKIRAYSIEQALVSVKYQGKGLGLLLYKALISKLDFTLLSNDSHSPGARKLWVKLNQDNAINVYGFDLQSNRVFSVEPNGSMSELEAMPKDIKLYDNLSSGLIATRKNGQDDETLRVLLKQSQIKFGS